MSLFLYLLVTLAIATAGMSSAVLFEPRKVFPTVAVGIFWGAVVVAALGLRRLMRRDLYAVCQYATVMGSSS